MIGLSSADYQELSHRQTPVSLQEDSLSLLNLSFVNDFVKSSNSSCNMLLKHDEVFVITGSAKCIIRGRNTMFVFLLGFTFALASSALAECPEVGITALASNR